MSIESAPALSGRLDNIQALRGLAALSVLFYHLALFIREGVFTGQSGFPAGPWDQGWAGVDLFFVISGFIMVWTTRDLVPKAGASLAFLWRRATRIYPLWWICAGIMAAYFIVAYGMPAAPDRVDGPGEAWAYALKSFALWPQDPPPLLGVGWTLIHEMWFYLIFALILLLPRRVLPIALLIWAAVTLFHYFGLGDINNHAVRKIMFSPLNLEFIGGALTALILLRPKTVSRPISFAIFFAGLIWITSAMTLDIQFIAQDHHFTRTVIYGPGMVLLVWGSTAMMLAGRLKIPRWMIALGDWSYALYLIHYIVLIGLRRMLQETGLSSTSEPGFWPILLFGVAVLTLTFIMSWALHRFVELPMLAFFRRKRDHSPGQRSG